MGWGRFALCCLLLFVLAAAGLGRAYHGYYELQVGSNPPSPLPRVYALARDTFERRLLPAWRMHLADLARAGDHLLHRLAEAFHDPGHAP